MEKCPAFSARSFFCFSWPVILSSASLSPLVYYRVEEHVRTAIRGLTGGLVHAAVGVGDAGPEGHDSGLLSVSLPILGL